MRIAYVCEGGGELGWGHVGRGRALIESAGPGSSFVIGRGFDEIRAWFDRFAVGLPVIGWLASDDPLDPQEFDVIIVDHYTLSSEWIAAADKITPTFVVDDWMRARGSATGFINPNVGAVEHGSFKARVRCMGPGFALLRREVRNAGSFSSAPQAEIKTILISLGGSDPDGYTALIASRLVERPLYGEVGLSVVLGPSYQGPEPWRGWSRRQLKRVHVLSQPANFIELCAHSDFVISAAGTTTYELAHLGRPFIPVAVVKNQARISREWGRIGIGEAIAVWDHGWLERLEGLSDRLIRTPDQRLAIAAKGAALVDGRGAERILAACQAVRDQNAT